MKLKQIDSLWYYYSKDNKWMYLPVEVAEQIKELKECSIVISNEFNKQADKILTLHHKIKELKEYVTHKEDCREWDDDCGCGLDQLLNKH